LSPTKRIKNSRIKEKKRKEKKPHPSLQQADQWHPRLGLDKFSHSPSQILENQCALFRSFSEKKMPRGCFLGGEK
jgi:hypothetical protein